MTKNPLSWLLLHLPSEPEEPCSSISFASSPLPPHQLTTSWDLFPPHQHEAPAFFTRFFFQHPCFLCTLYLFYSCKTPNSDYRYNSLSPISIKWKKLHKWVDKLLHNHDSPSTAHEYLFLSLSVLFPILLSNHFKFHHKASNMPLSLLEYDLSPNFKEILLPPNMISFNFLPTHMHPLSTFTVIPTFILCFSEDSGLLLQRIPHVPFQSHTLSHCLASPAILSFLCISNLSLSPHSLTSVSKASWVHSKNNAVLISCLWTINHPISLLIQTSRKSNHHPRPLRSYLQSEHSVEIVIVNVNGSHHCQMLQKYIDP